MISSGTRPNTPVRSTQRIPFNTARRSFQGRPRPSLGRIGSGISSSIIFHRTSVRSLVLARGMAFPCETLRSEVNRDLEAEQSAFASFFFCYFSQAQLLPRASKPFQLVGPAFALSSFSFLHLLQFAPSNVLLGFGGIGIFIVLEPETKPIHRPPLRRHAYRRIGQDVFISIQHY